MPPLNLPIILSVYPCPAAAAQAAEAPLQRGVGPVPADLQLQYGSVLLQQGEVMMRSMMANFRNAPEMAAASVHQRCPQVVPPPPKVVPPSSLPPQVPPPSLPPQMASPLLPPDLAAAKPKELARQISANMDPNQLRTVAMARAAENCIEAHSEVKADGGYGPASSTSTCGGPGSGSFLCFRDGATATHDGGCVGALAGHSGPGPSDGQVRNHVRKWNTKSKAKYNQGEANMIIMVALRKAMPGTMVRYSDLKFERALKCHQINFFISQFQRLHPQEELMVQRGRFEETTF